MSAEIPGLRVQARNYYCKERASISFSPECYLPKNGRLIQVPLKYTELNMCSITIIEMVSQIPIMDSGERTGMRKREF